MALRTYVPLILSFFFLAGCTMPSTPAADDALPTGEPAIDASTYAIHVHWAIGSVPAGSNFTFEMGVDGKVVSQSPHIGAHFGPAHVEAAQASKTTYPTACAHVGGQLPNEFHVTCTAPMTPGTYYLRGHAQEARGETVTNWWSDEVSFQVHV